MMHLQGQSLDGSLNPLSGERKLTRSLLLSALMLASVSGCGALDFRGNGGTYSTVKVGVLHSRTGTMSLSENTVAEAELLAIEEINRQGGITIAGKNHRIEAIEEDGASQPQIFASKASKLLKHDKVAVVFGGWTSSSRKAMLPVFETANRFLFYPVQFEGQECSPTVLYAGSVPNQQSEPAVEWLLKHKGKRIVLIGSDYLYPRSTNQQIRQQLTGRAEIVGEHYLPLGQQDVSAVVAAIRRSLPQGGVIVNTLNGDTNVAFFNALAAASLTAAHGYTVMSFSVSEEEVAAIGSEPMLGTMASWSFFQSLATPSARGFTTRFQEAYGAHRVTNDPAEAAYTMVKLWAAAVERAQSLDTDRVRQALIGLSLEAPQGTVTVNPNLHLSKHALIGEVQANGQFRIVHDGGRIPPLPWGSAAKQQPCDWRQPRKR